MRKLSEKQLLIVTIAVSVLIAGVMVGLILNDKSDIEAVEVEIGQIEQHIRVCDLEIAKTQSREDRVLVFRAVEQRELAILPTQQMIADFLRSLSTYFGSAGINFHEAPESSPNESQLAKGIYETRTKLSLTGDAPSILRFMNMVENDPRLVAIKGYRIGAGKLDKLNPNKVIEHEVEMTLATYFYNPAAASVRRVHIPNEQKRLQDPKIQGTIDSFEPERPDTYVLRPSASRRDPFVDPREQRQTEDEEVLRQRYEKELAVVESIETLQREIAEMIEQEKALISAGDLFRADRLGQAVDSKVNSIRAELGQVMEMKRVTIASLQARVQEILSWLDTIAGRRPARDVTVTVMVASKMLAELEELFRGGDFTELQNQGNAWDAYVRGKETDSGARLVLTRIKALRRKATNLRDFAALQIQVRAIIVADNDPSRNVALINGTAYKSGDKLDERGEVVVGRIGRSTVVFRFRGEVSYEISRGKSSSMPRGVSGVRSPR